MQAIGASLAGQGDGVEERGFEEQVAGAVADAAVLTTHHPGDGQGALVVGDHQGVGAQGDFLAVEQDQLLAVLGHAHAHAAVDLGKVEGMHRLAQFDHHVVGDVDHRVDTANVGTAQALDHPQRGRPAQVDVADHPAEIARAGGRRVEFDRTGLVVLRGDRIHRHRRQRYVVDGADFAGQAGERQAVTAVRGQADLDGVVVQLQVGADVLADRRVSRQLEQTGVLFADLQFLGRAEHAEGLDATQLGFLDLEVARQFGADHGEGNLQARAHVGRAADDLEGLAAVADLADAQLVGVRMLFGREHLADHHAAEGAGDRQVGVDLEADHGQASDQLVMGNLRICPAPQPLFTEFHPVLLRNPVAFWPSGIVRGSADRYRRTDAGRSPRSAAWPGARRPCRRRSPGISRDRCWTCAARSGAPCRNP